MKNYIKSSFYLLFLVLGFSSCEYDGIDPITPVDPGADAGAPEVRILFPNEGTSIQVPEAVASVNIRFEVKDDIEVDVIEVLVNGNVIATFNDFLDYRIVNEQVVFDQVTNGEHTVTVRATDLAGNTTSQTVNFSKEPPYTPKYPGEFLYMPFDADFSELVNLYMGEETGTPGISSDSQLGDGSYMGENESYITIPLDGENMGNELTAAFWYKMDNSNANAGILTATDDANLNQGFRLFREPVPGEPNLQQIKLNVGTGEGSAWNDGGRINIEEDEWVHVAFTFSPTGTAIYFNGDIVNVTEANVQIDWTGVEDLVIGSGLNFEGWGHNSDTSLIDELRLFNRALSAEEIAAMVDEASVTLYMPFEENYRDMVSNRAVTVEGDPGFAGEAAVGMNAYAGAEGSYLSLPADGLTSEDFSTTFWYKLNATPDRAGILIINAVNEENPDANNLNHGIQLFREDVGGEQHLKVIAGSGEGNSWNNGGSIQEAGNDWVHVAVTISDSENRIYFNGELINTTPIDGGVSWMGGETVTIMSGEPAFTEWNHFSDHSHMDELRFYNKVLTQEEIQTQATMAPSE
ncbi:MAG TPA: LamG-like jellyroll fold domain-containing protein [Gillisia sp.]|nr:LamG-like jellyroll fold domain-containing protein [Gillisia sp.]